MEENLEKKEIDYINPNHYKQFSKETIDMMIAIWEINAVILYCEMTAFKYKIRMGDKIDQPVERDLGKSRWYLNKANELKESKLYDSESWNYMKSLKDIEIKVNDPTDNVKINIIK